MTRGVTAHAQILQDQAMLMIVPVIKDVRVFLPRQWARMRMESTWEGLEMEDLIAQSTHL